MPEHRVITAHRANRQSLTHKVTVAECAGRHTFTATRNPVGASLLAKAVCQLKRYRLTLPLREQARSYKGVVCSAARVVFGVQILQTGARDMGVDLRCGQVAVPEQHLHHAQICAVVEQMRGERVTQGVR